MKNNNFQKITPCLWFDKQAEDAVKFYTSVFKDSKILRTSHYGEGMPGPAGTVMTISFLLQGQEFTALNGGPDFKFNEAVSLVVKCETQEEIDMFWEKLSADGGQKVECGWLKDKFGLSWQVVPAALDKMVSDSDPERSQKVMQELLRMKKLDIKTLEQAYNEKVTT